MRNHERAGSEEHLRALRVELRALERKHPDFADAKELAPALRDLARRYR